MKRSNLLKLLVILITASMVLSLFACADEGTTTTEAPGEESTESTTESGETTEAPGTTTTEAPGTTTTEAPGTTTTEAPGTTTTEAPGTTTTEAPGTTTTEAPGTTTTEAPGTTTTEPVESEPYEEEVKEPTVNAGYYLSMVHGGLDNKQLYLNGEMDGYYFGTTEDRDEAVRVFLETAEGGYYMYHVVDAVKVYINIVKNGTYTNTVFGAEPVSVWNYDATLGTMVTDCEGTSYFLGTRNDKTYSTFSACEVKYTDNYKAVFTVYMEWDDGEYVVDCYHPFIAVENGHVKPACSLCGKADGNVQEHDPENIVTEGETHTTYQVKCSICGYVASGYQIGNDVNLYIPAAELLSNPGYGYTKEMMNEGFDFVHYSGAGSGHINIWAADGAYGAGIPKLFEGNSGKYLVIKIRIAGTHLQALNMKATTGELSNQNIEPYATSEFNTGWQVWVVDLASWTNYETNKENAEIQIRLDPWDQNPVYTVDIAYAAIVDSVDEISGVVTDDTYCLKSNWKDAGALKNTVDGSCAAHAVAETYADGKYTVGCPACGETLAEKTVSADVNKYISAGAMFGSSNLNFANGGASNSFGVDNGVAYFRHQSSGASGSYINVWSATNGGGSAKAFDANTGNFIVMKYRTTKASAVVIQVTTNGTLANIGERNNTKGATTVNQEGWEVAVISLANVANYETSATDKSVQIRVDLYGNGEQILDIAFVAVVDSLEEAATLADANSKTYQYYETFSGDGVRYDKTTNQEYVPAPGSEESVPMDVQPEMNDAWTEATATVTVPANSTYYFQAFGIGGMIMSIDGGEGTLLSGNPRMPVLFTVTNDTAEEKEFALKFTYPLGSMSNPETLELGDKTVGATADGYNLKWIATGNGLFTVTMTGDNWSVTVNNMTTYIYGDIITSEDETTVASIWVNEGDEVQIIVGTADGTAADVSFTAALVPACADDAHTYAAVDGTGWEIKKVSYVCSACGHTAWTYNYPDSINTHLGPVYIATRPVGATFQVTDLGIMNEDGVIFNRLQGQGKIGQIFWSRIGGDGNGSWPVEQINPVEVQDGKYLVIKMRASAYTMSNINLKLGTILGEASYDNRGAMVAADLNLPISAMTANEWEIVVIDLEKLCGNVWAQQENGLRKLVYLQYTFNGAVGAEDTIDFSYMAFADDWTEIQALTETDSVLYMSASASAVEINSDGTCKDAHVATEKYENGTYTYYCGICGEEIGTKNVSEAINAFSSPVQMMIQGHFAFTSSIEVEEGVVYAHFTGATGGHATVFGNNFSTGKTVADSGKYLVIKMRTNIPGTNWSFSISNKVENGAIVLDGGGADSASLSGGWDVLVVDLSAYPLFTADAENTPILVRFNTWGTGTTGFIDVAYAALVDDLSEVAGVVEEETYIYYANKLSGGNKTYSTETGAEYVPPYENVGVTHVFQPADLTGSNHYQASGTVVEASDTDPAYIKYTATASGCFVNLYNGGDVHGACKAFAPSTGKYIVIKYRTQGASSIVFKTSTNGAAASSKEKNQNKGALPTEWEVAVLDVAQFANYTPNQLNSSLLLRMEFYGSGTHSIDIAYIALLDDLSAAGDAITEETFKYYADWSVPGVDYTTATATPVEG